MVGAERFEVSFLSGHYAVFFVEIKGKPNLNQRLQNFSGVPFFPYSLTKGPDSARNWYHWYHPCFLNSAQSQLTRRHMYNVMGLAWFPTRVTASRSVLRVRSHVEWLRICVTAADD